MTHISGTGTLASLRALPKAEVHVHLEGAFEPSTLEKWSAEAGVPMPRPRERLFEFQGLADFLNFLDWACGLVNSAERLAEMAYDFNAGLPMRHWLCRRHYQPDPSACLAQQDPRND